MKLLPLLLLDPASPPAASPSTRGSPTWSGTGLDARTHVVKTFIDGAEVYSR